MHAAIVFTAFGDFMVRSTYFDHQGSRPMACELHQATNPLSQQSTFRPGILVGSAAADSTGYNLAIISIAIPTRAPAIGPG